MRRAFEKFRLILAKHAFGLPLTSLISLVLSSVLPFLRWPCHVAFMQSMKRAERSVKPFPDIFFKSAIDHIFFYLLLTLLAFPFLYALILAFVCLMFFASVFTNGAMIFVLVLISVVFTFFLLHPLSFFLVYSWENKEGGFAEDMKLLGAYFRHWFGRPSEHLLFSLKCFFVYFLCALLFLATALAFSALFFSLNFFLPQPATILTSGFAVLIFLALLALGFLYLAPFISYLTLLLYEPLAPEKSFDYVVEDAAEEPERSAHWKMTVAYDGTKFCGWQYQPGQRTVQGELTAALRRLLREETVLTAASRTDSGVHALGQTMDFLTTREFEPEKLLKAVNGFVPDDISVSAAELVDADFHSTFSACGKHYRYTVWTAASDDIMTRNFHYWLNRDLDIEAMNEAAKIMVGEREFKGLQVKSGKPNEATVRLVTEVSVKKRGNELVIDVFGKGFMYKQVRSMVGLLLAVGEGRVKALEVDALCSGEARCRMTSVAPPQGLCLVKVYYNQEEFEKRL